MTTPVPRPAVVDAHVHLWDLAVRPQPWTEDLPPLRGSFTAGEIDRVRAMNGVHAAIVVQAGDTTDETVDLMARSPRAAVKRSGLVTEADWTGWTQRHLDPVISPVAVYERPSRFWSQRGCSTCDGGTAPTSRASNHIYS
jgi:hypothetical protein